MRIYNFRSSEQTPRGRTPGSRGWGRSRCTRSRQAVFPVRSCGGGGERPRGSTSWRHWCRRRAPYTETAPPAGEDSLTAPFLTRLRSCPLPGWLRRGGSPAPCPTQPLGAASCLVPAGGQAPHRSRLAATSAGCSRNACHPARTSPSLPGWPRAFVGCRCWVLSGDLSGNNNTVFVLFFN